MEFFQYDTKSDLYKEEIDLRDKVLRKPLGLKLTPEFLESDKNDLHFCIINKSGRMVACVLIKPLSDKKVKLRQMAVDDQERGKGIGAYLIEKTETILREGGISVIELHARKYAEGFYLKSGYSPIGEEFTEIGIPHIKMVKIISP